MFRCGVMSETGKRPANGSAHEEVLEVPVPEGPPSLAQVALVPDYPVPRLEVVLEGDDVAVLCHLPSVHPDHRRDQDLKSGDRDKGVARHDEPAAEAAFGMDADEDEHVVDLD